MLSKFGRGNWAWLTWEWFAEGSSPNCIRFAARSLSGHLTGG